MSKCDAIEERGIGDSIELLIKECENHNTEAIKLLFEFIARGMMFAPVAFAMARAAAAVGEVALRAEAEKN